MSNDEGVPAEITERTSGLERDLADVLNRHSAENESGTPDFILAAFLTGVLEAYNNTLGQRAAWRGESVELPALTGSKGAIEIGESVRAGLEEGLRKGDEVYGPDAFDGQDGKEVPLVIYTEGRRNEVGTAKVQVFPGELQVTGKITGAIPVIADPNAPYSLELNEPKDEPLGKPSHKDALAAEASSAFQRYQQRGLSENG